MKNLNELGVIELNSDETSEVIGGLWWLAGALLISAIDNFGDIRQGLADGFNGTPRY